MSPISGHVPKDKVSFVPHVPPAQVDSHVQVPPYRRPTNTLEGVSVHHVTIVPTVPPTFRTWWTQGDGNCQFSAFARAMGMGQSQASEVRSTTVQWMRDHPGDFVPFVSTMSTPFPEYLQAMSTQGEWGDNLTLTAMCQAYKAYVVVLKMMDNGDMMWTAWGDSETAEVVHWLYLSGNHYENLLFRDQISFSVHF